MRYINPRLLAYLTTSFQFFMNQTTFYNSNRVNLNRGAQYRWHRRKFVLFWTI